MLLLLFFNNFMFRARVLPSPPVEKNQPSIGYLLTEFTKDEIDKIDLIGLPIWFSHDGDRDHREAGVITDQYISDDGSLCCCANLYYNAEGLAAAALIEKLGYKEVSLQHTTRYDPDTKQYNKTFVEVSICKKGKRDSPIMEFVNHTELEQSQLASDPIDNIRQAFEHVGRELTSNEFSVPVRASVTDTNIATTARSPSNGSDGGIRWDVPFSVYSIGDNKKIYRT